MGHWPSGLCKIAKNVTYIGHKTKFIYQIKQLNCSKKAMIEPKVALIGLHTRYFQKSEGQLKSDFIIGPRREQTCLLGFANNNGADQPAYPRRLISAFVIRFLKVSYMS